jgi:uncharacterized OB-fold protein
VSLTERLQFFHEAIAWKGEIPLQSRYTMGIAGERFFKEIRDHGRLMAAHCPDCDFTYMPPRLYCERCFAELTDWLEVSPQGYVYAYTVVHLNLDEEPLDEPELIAFIRLDGCDGGLIHRLGEVDADAVCIGMPVEAVFQKEREGALQDIAYFRPI